MQAWGVCSGLGVEVLIHTKPRSRTLTVEHCGKPVRGVQMSKPGPLGWGCFELFNRGEATAKTKAILARSEQGNTEEELDESMIQASKRVRATTTARATTDGGVQLRTTTHASSSAAQEIDEEDDDAIIDNLWGRSLVKRGRGGKAADSDQEGEASKAAPKASTGGHGNGGSPGSSEAPQPQEASDNQSNKRRRKQSANNAGAADDANDGKTDTVTTPKKPPSNAAKELDTAETMILKAEQTLQSLTDHRFLNVTVATMTERLDKVGRCSIATVCMSRLLIALEIPWSMMNMVAWVSLCVNGYNVKSQDSSSQDYSISTFLQNCYTAMVSTVSMAEHMSHACWSNNSVLVQRGDNSATK